MVFCISVDRRWIEQQSLKQSDFKVTLKAIVEIQVSVNLGLYYVALQVLSFLR